MAGIVVAAPPDTPVNVAIADSVSLAFRQVAPSTLVIQQSEPSVTIVKWPRPLVNVPSTRSFAGRTNLVLADDSITKGLPPKVVLVEQVVVPEYVVSFA